MITKSRWPDLNKAHYTVIIHVQFSDMKQNFKPFYLLIHSSLCGFVLNTDRTWFGSLKDPVLDSGLVSAGRWRVNWTQRLPVSCFTIFWRWRLRADEEFQGFTTATFPWRSNVLSVFSLWFLLHPHTFLTHNCSCSGRFKTIRLCVCEPQHVVVCGWTFLYEKTESTTETKTSGTFDQLMVSRCMFLCYRKMMKKHKLQIKNDRSSVCASNPEQLDSEDPADGQVNSFHSFSQVNSANTWNSIIY